MINIVNLSMVYAKKQQTSAKSSRLLECYGECCFILCKGNSFFLQITKSEENNCEILSIDKNKTDLMLHFICQNSPEYYWLLLTVNVLCVFANVIFIKIITIFICLVLLSFLILLKKSH